MAGVASQKQSKGIPKDSVSSMFRTAAIVPMTISSTATPQMTYWTTFSDNDTDSCCWAAAPQKRMHGKSKFNGALRSAPTNATKLSKKGYMNERERG